ncbi:peptide chain release factor family protein [Gimesia fumaroli]|uniref:Peptide chain release factor 1 n=1 Tax=Gimesia fumaroli TaxID=2527976 RepID=A0A518IDC6_9PLAN|nr:peptide chain release factor-like protein [Gimesia fumaroli]QDV51074.1 Peptide chain release factor 1 [Gimesia fumaroli]
MTSADNINLLSGKIHPACLDEDALLKDCKIQHVKRSGPGGQHRNKVETGVVIKHLPTNVMGEASETRQQARNRQAALFRLRVNLAVECRLENIPEHPSTLWKRRLSSGTVKVNLEHHDFPALLAEALDTITHFQFDVKSASQFLGCSSSQLIKFCKKEPRALSWVNQMRQQAGLHSLK